MSAIINYFFPSPQKTIPHNSELYSSQVKTLIIGLRVIAVIAACKGFLTSFPYFAVAYACLEGATVAGNYARMPEEIANDPEKKLAALFENAPICQKLLPATLKLMNLITQLL